MERRRFLRNRRLWTTAAVVETDALGELLKIQAKRVRFFDAADGVKDTGWARNSGFQGGFMTNSVDFVLILLKFWTIIFNLIYNYKKYACF
ncbi:hypothetical protein [Acidovorax temperans]|uniref:hypothetical protein n=1 Tax=Acidovorax temperans TaxID=80878 RepID=UPI0012EDCFB6|nr:hypothetical protein [Acidovorax temperans]